jgi:NhaP-type Na+/H+ or K+/H+ antiporter
MEDKTRHILWGTLLYFLNTVLFTILGPIFRSVQDLSYSQMYALQVLAEVVSFLPLTPYAVRHWSISTWKEWGIYLYLTITGASYFIPYIYCSHVMPFGDLAALEISGILLAPVVAGVLYSRSLDALRVPG